MTTTEKLAEAEAKLLKLQAKVAKLRLRKQNECDHVYLLTGSYNDDDGYSRRVCTQVNTYTCALCSHSYKEKREFNA